MKISRREYWNNKENQLNFLNALGRDLGFKRMRDWYNITPEQIRENGGSPLLEKHDNSPSKLLKFVYNTYRWNELKFLNLQHRKARGYWNDPINQREFLDNLGKEFGFKCLDDWYIISIKQIMAKGGGGLLDKYGSIRSKMLISVYDSHQWNISYFQTKMQVHYWEMKERRINLVKELAKKLRVVNLSDWYRISHTQIGEYCNRVGLFRKYPLEKLLAEAYPDFPWDIPRLQSRERNKASQRWLMTVVQHLFPNSGNFSKFVLIL
jgi:hypothetical protein